MRYLRKARESAKEREWHDLFEVGIILKAIDGVLDLIGGVLLWVIPPAALDAFVRFLFAGELIEDPRDWLVNGLLHLTQNLANGLQAYASILLLVHGVVKIFLVAAIRRGKLWAYPASIAIFSGFVVFQLYQLALQYSLLLWVITIIDVLVIGLIVHEYRYVLRRNPQRQ